ncbi:MAG: thermonuclease family protein [Candidatus Paceibacterota bacterium]
MNKSIVLALTLLFGLTVMIGVLTPNEAEEIERTILSYLEEEIEVESAIEPSSSTIKSSSQTPVTKTKEEVDDEGVIERVLYSVVRVIDGDTIVINKDGVSESVRLIGIDTPETVHSSKPVQCFGMEASKKTKEWLEGKSVELIIDEGEGERDKYRRLLGYVYREDGMFINLELIKQGYAYEYTYQQPYKYQKEFKAAQAEASSAKRGLWADDACG